MRIENRQCVRAAVVARHGHDLLTPQPRVDLAVNAAVRGINEKTDPRGNASDRDLRDVPVRRGRGILHVDWLVEARQLLYRFDRLTDLA